MTGELKIEKQNLEKTQPISSKTEKPLSPENRVETALPTIEKKDVISLNQKVPNVGSFVPVPPVSDWQKKQEQAIDIILSEGLDEIFLKMKPEEQKAFKKKGEETVSKISALLNSAKVKINKIVALIREWLSMVKGINKFFLEQEVKIKADKVLRLKDK